LAGARLGWISEKWRDSGFAKLELKSGATLVTSFNKGVIFNPKHVCG